jgi:thiamine biosynthesis protein ThiI
MDKLEIIACSKKIDTYEISIRPYEDCCTIFTPKAPKTAPNLEEARSFEERFDYKSLIAEALDNIEVKIIS